MTLADAAATAPLDDDLLAMDVADTLRREGLSVQPGDAQAISTLSELYRAAGIEIGERQLQAGIAAAATRRYDYVPPQGPAAALARLYVQRRHWGPIVVALLVLALLVLGGYLFAYRPYQAAQLAEAQLQLRQQLPDEMDTLYQAIYDETKVQTAADQAAQLRDAGKAAASKGDRDGAMKAVADLRALRDRLEEAYTLRVVDADGVKPGFWTFPANNSEATNYYIVVEALDSSGQILSLPIANDDSGTTSTVERWGLRVPEAIYQAVMADKADDGIIQHSLVGIKQDGFINIDYVVPVLGGTLTQW